jgi:hypothetical protein
MNNRKMQNPFIILQKIFRVEMAGARIIFMSSCRNDSNGKWVTQSEMAPLLGGPEL